MRFRQGYQRRRAAADRAAAAPQVRVREHERDVPLYVLIRKWVQNDPETELMQQPPAPDPPQPAGGPALGAQMETGAGEPLGGAEKPEEAAEEPERAGEEPEQYAQPAPVQAPLPLAHRELPPTEVTCPGRHNWSIPDSLRQCGMCLRT